MVGRSLCRMCLQPGEGCYCALLTPFDPKVQFVILMHPIERRRRVATGRMSHLFLQRSRLIVGHDYSLDKEVNEIVDDPANRAMILYPGSESLDLEAMDAGARTAFFSTDRNIVIFVIDGTWATAKKTMHLSRNLRTLPRICYAPSMPSRFQVRRQPSPLCHSTLEAIHYTLEVAGPSWGFDAASRVHDRLLRPFERMVKRQIAAPETSRRAIRL